MYSHIYVCAWCCIEILSCLRPEWRLLPFPTPGSDNAHMQWLRRTCALCCQFLNPLREPGRKSQSGPRNAQSATGGATASRHRLSGRSGAFVCPSHTTRTPSGADSRFLFAGSANRTLWLARNGSVHRRKRPMEVPLILASLRVKSSRSDSGRLKWRKPEHSPANVQDAVEQAGGRETRRHRKVMKRHA
jgi:hypothetical protein